MSWVIPISTPALKGVGYFVISTKSDFWGMKKSPKYFVLYPAKSACPTYLFSSASMLLLLDDPKKPAAPTRKDSMLPTWLIKPSINIASWVPSCSGRPPTQDSVYFSSKETSFKLLKEVEISIS